MMGFVRLAAALVHPRGIYRIWNACHMTLECTGRRWSRERLS